MEHIYISGPDKKAPTLLLLHGTGGNERDLMPLANLIASDVNILGVRGNVLENGMPRFFRRLSEGVFDEEDLVFRTRELDQFINESAEQYGFNRDKVVAVGYSNGANIAASLLYHYEKSLRGAILFHAMVPLRNVELPDLTGIPVFIGAGKRDHLIPPAETKQLSDSLQNANADVTEHWGNGGHELTRDEVEEAKKWFEKYFL
ncbi:alpha/beta hydrolase [Bacillus sp. T33-2]|uniref:alpha/beta hydrolase n=1 Tax=Bacillus sp. T33-2 TaxID=2054168 RepID=UPI000C75E204|nr:alpha/beta hydrolase [Bacillus sp. T33-2]PLR98758.1 carboxylesterase [Bacillus sp. T33-2]